MYLTRRFHTALVVTLGVMVAGGCTSRPSADSDSSEEGPHSALPLPEPPSKWPSSGSDAANAALGAGASVTPDDCREALARAVEIPALAGTPSLDEARPHVLLYAKAEPVVFTREPEVDTTSSKEAVRYRAMLERGSPWTMMKRLWSVFSSEPDLGRSALLREGYLYADKPELAFALVDLVSAQLLFSDKEIWIQRGERLLTAERSRTGHYVFTNGPERGQRVRLLLFDRVGTGPVPAPLHRDFRALRLRLGFDGATIRHLTERAIVADLRYGALTVPTLLEADGAHLELGCEAPSAVARPKLAAMRLERAKKERLLVPLRQAMLAQVEEGLPFDEPITEYGQQDGRLRREWQRAYLGGRGSYKLQGDRYYVFNGAGRPLVPQVCVDFVFDTFERAGGSWWRGMGEPRERVIGKLDFHTLSDETRRRATGFVELAQSRPEAFDVYVLPDSEHVPFKYPRELSRYLVTHADKYQAGDVVMIRGYAPWDMRERLMHFHSFFVYETDPMTGMPITLAGNPGKPLLQTWQFEAFRTPERSIWYRIRPRTEWLSDIVKTSEVLPAHPPPLATDRLDRSANEAPATAAEG